MAGGSTRRKLDSKIHYAPLDVVADAAHLGKRLPRRILELPVDVALAGDVRALVPAAHGHDDVGPLHVVAVEPVGRAVRDVDVQLACPFLGLELRLRDESVTLVTAFPQGLSPNDWEW
jgi:hypothetical protein